MPFDRVAYLEWAHSKPAVKYNLSGSSVPTLEPEQVEFDWSGTRFSGPNQYGYVPLLEAIASRYGVRPANVVTACGTSMANFLVCAALISPGDEVIVEKPCYGPMLDVPLALGARVKRLPRSFEDGYCVDVRALQKAASRKTKLIILTNLHNPSGVSIDRPTLEEIGCLGESLRIPVLVDEIYLDFLFDRDYRTCHQLNRCFVSTNSLTKVYGLDGLRCGWILADEKIARRLWRVRDYVDANGPFPAQMASARLFPSLDVILARSRVRCEENLPLVTQFVQSCRDLAWVTPHGGVVCFPRYRHQVRLDGLLRSLPVTHDTLVVPGRFFESPRHFRIGFGIDKDTLVEGLQRLKHALAEFQSRNP